MRKITICLSFMMSATFGFAQTVEDAIDSANVSTEAASQTSASVSQPVEVVKVRYGYCSCLQLLQSMPEYTKAVQELTKLREQLEKEVYHNETEFRRQYSEYLNGQKDFPQAILLKRQRDLQAAMENGIAFRMQGDSLLRKAEEDIMAPLRNRVEEAIRSVGMERGLDYVIDIDKDVYVFLRPELSEDITAYAEEKLKGDSVNAK